MIWDVLRDMGYGIRQKTKTDALWDLERTRPSSMEGHDKNSGGFEFSQRFSRSLCFCVHLLLVACSSRLDCCGSDQDQPDSLSFAHSSLIFFCSFLPYRYPSLFPTFFPWTFLLIILCSISLVSILEAIAKMVGWRVSVGWTGLIGYRIMC